MEVREQEKRGDKEEYVGSFFLELFATAETHNLPQVPGMSIFSVNGIKKINVETGTVEVIKGEENKMMFFARGKYLGINPADIISVSFEGRKEDDAPKLLYLRPLLQ